MKPFHMTELLKCYAPRKVLLILWFLQVMIWWASGGLKNMRDLMPC
jgi:hypothetical protein